MDSNTDSSDMSLYSSHSMQHQEELVEDYVVSNQINQMSAFNNEINRRSDTLSLYGSVPEEFWCQVSSAAGVQEALQLEASDNMGSFESMEFIDPSALEVGEEIAEGGQAHIFLAVWNRVDERVPVVAKKLKGVTSDLGESKSLWRQLRNVVEIRGKYLCEVLGVCRKDDAVFVVMERMLGDLRNFMDKTLLRWNDPSTAFFMKFHMIGSISFGMKELHMRGLFHRDLMASNVLIGRVSEKNPNLPPDFTFSFCFKVGDYESSEGVVGTGFWRAPEVLQQLKDGLTPDLMVADKADVYSYAMLCYEILTGCVPFQGHPLSNYDLVLSGERPEFPANLSERLRRLLESCWHKEPQQRPNFEQITRVVG